MMHRHNNYVSYLPLTTAGMETRYQIHPVPRAHGIHWLRTFRQQFLSACGDAHSNSGINAVSRVICYVAVRTSAPRLSTKDERGDDSISGEKNKEIEEETRLFFRIPPDTSAGCSQPRHGGPR